MRGRRRRRALLALLAVALYGASTVPPTRAAPRAKCEGAPFAWRPYASGEAQAQEAWRRIEGRLREANAKPSVFDGAYTSRNVPRVRGGSWGQWNPAPHCDKAARGVPADQSTARANVREWLRRGGMELVDGDEAARELLGCLAADDTCLQDDGGDARQRSFAVAALAAALPSMRRVRQSRRTLLGETVGPVPARCLTLTRTGACARANVQRGNPDTFPRAGYTPVRLSDRPRTDMPRRTLGGSAGTCALVANGPLVRVGRNGAAIDAHGAVWRFNAVFEPRLERSAVQADMGHRTDVRWFSRPRGAQAARCKTRFCTDRKKLRGGTTSETWVLWNYESMNDVAPLRRHFAGVVPRLLHPRASERIYDAYFQFRADLATLHRAVGAQQLPDMTCPKALSTGVHAALTAVTACGRGVAGNQTRAAGNAPYIAPVSLFGFSYSSDVLKTRSGHLRRYASNANKHRMYTGHGWDVDVRLLRVLTLAGLAEVCTADNPSMSEADLQHGRVRARGV